MARLPTSVTPSGSSTPVPAGTDDVIESVAVDEPILASAANIETEMINRNVSIKADLFIVLLPYFLSVAVYRDCDGCLVITGDKVI